MATKQSNNEIATPCGLAMTESGRSMVEMLGVLAVIGVLSVAGIAGYTTAMNKHRANELLYEASKRSTMVAMQMASGRGANIDEFAINGTQDFTVSGNAGDPTFTLTIANVEAEVCKQLVNAAGTTGMVRKITSGGTETAGDASKCTTGAMVLTYNANLSTTDSTSGGGTTTCTPACSSTQECVDGNCIAKADPNDSSSCAKNSDCDTWCKNQTGAAACYCQISADSTGTENACWNNFTGTCATISSTEKDQKYKEGGMTWWSAKNFCKAIGYPMASKQSACNGTLYSCLDTPDEYWLSDCYCENSSDDSTCTCNDNSCRARRTFSGLSVTDTRNTNFSALCK